MPLTASGTGYRVLCNHFDLLVPSGGREQVLRNEHPGMDAGIADRGGLKELGRNEGIRAWTRTGRQGRSALLTLDRAGTPAFPKWPLPQKRIHIPAKSD